MKKLILISLCIAIFYFGYSVISIPNYSDGRTYTSYSPDGKYKLDHVFPPDESADSVLVLTEIETQNVVTIHPVTLPAYASVNPAFYCNDDNSSCYKYELQIRSDRLILPPLPWTKLRAWLAIKYHHLEDPKLSIEHISDRYPPVTKQKQ